MFRSLKAKETSSLKENFFYLYKKSNFYCKSYDKPFLKCTVKNSNIKKLPLFPFSYGSEGLKPQTILILILIWLWRPQTSDHSDSDSDSSDSDSGSDKGLPTPDHSDSDTSDLIQILILALLDVVPNLRVDF